MGAAEIISIYGDDVDPRKASERVVAVLEKQLEKARSGEIVGIAMAFSYFDGSVGRESGGIFPPALIGSTYLLLRDLAEIGK